MTLFNHFTSRACSRFPMQKPFSPLILGLLTFGMLQPTIIWGQASQNAPKTQAPQKEATAVMDFVIKGGTDIDASAASDKFREELFNSGKFTLVDRSQMDIILKEQALQQSGCTNQECAVKLGRILGVKKIITGQITKPNYDFWQVSINIIDVETAQILKIASETQKGDISHVLARAIPVLAAKIAGENAPSMQPIQSGFGQLHPLKKLTPLTPLGSYQLMPAP